MNKLSNMQKQSAAVTLLLVISFCIYFFISSSAYTCDATIKAYRVDISSDMPGRITKLYVDEGDHVGKAQPVMHVDVKRIDAAIATALSVVKATQLEIDALQYKVLLGFDNFQRGIAAYNKGVIPFIEYDALEKVYLQLKADKELLLGKKKVAENEYKALLVEREYAVTKTPINGVIAKRWHSIGDIVSPGETVFTLFDLSDTWVEAFFDEKYVKNIQLGSKVKVYIDAYKGELFDGEVFAIKQAAQSNFSLLPMNNATGNFTKVSQRVPVKIRILSPKGVRLYPGLSCEVRIVK